MIKTKVYLMRYKASISPSAQFGLQTVIKKPC